jgi:hypothetical protein
MNRTPYSGARSAAGLAAGLVFGGLVQAQTFVAPDMPTPDQENDPPPVYVVEFIVFSYNDFNPFEEEFRAELPKHTDRYAHVELTATPERLPMGSAAWYLDDVLAPPEASDEPIGGAATTDPGLAANIPFIDTIDEYGNTIGTAPAPVEDDGRWYHMLTTDEFELDNVLARLRTLDAYTPLMHAGWSQKTQYEESAEAFELEWLGKLRPTGSIRLHRSRFLHLTVDLGLQYDYRYTQAAPPPDSPWPLAEFLRPVTYRIDIQRRVRSGELHFFDHPAFGVLIMVRPPPEAPESAEELAAPGPAA